MLNLKRNDIINTQNMIVSKYNSFIDKHQYGEFLKIHDINNISKQELLSKFITYINQLLKQSTKYHYDNEFEQPFEPKKIMYRLKYIMFPACVFKFNGQYEVALLLDVCENWKDVSSAEYILIPNRKESIYYNYMCSINNNKRDNIYCAESKNNSKYTSPRPDHASFTKTNPKYTSPKPDQSGFSKWQCDDRIETKPIKIKPITTEKKTFIAAKINSRELNSKENIIEYQYKIIKELFKFL